MNKLNDLKSLNKSNIKIHGLSNYPNSTTNLIVTNHTCLMDIFYIPMILDYEIVSAISARVMYKKDTNRQDIINSLLNPIPIEAHGIRYYKELCITNASNVLSNGISLSIFPEGIYIADKSVIYRGRTGSVRILFNALKDNSNINLVPISIKYNNKIDNIDSYNFDYNDIDIYVLEPIEYRKYYELYMNTRDYNIKNSCLHAVTDLSMKSIANSLNQVYCNNYFEIDKKNMILPNGNTISDLECNNIYYKNMYKNTLENDSKSLIKRLGR